MKRHPRNPRQPGSFDNSTFWDERYRQNLTLGSGGGSRGQNLHFKRCLLGDLIQRYRPCSVLDVGCGDIEVTREIPFEGSYLGIDLSPFIVERNREIRPDWQFLQGDFLELCRTNDVQADLVLCLDVLIHQHDRAIYQKFVSELLRASRAALVVNAFESLPRSGRLSPHVAFHEPITQTLDGAGVESIDRLGSFRNTLLVLVERSGAAAP